MTGLISILAALSVLTLFQADAPAPESVLAAHLERVRSAPREVTPDVFLGIARVGGRESRETLEKALELNVPDAALKRAYAAFSAYKGTLEESRALAYLTQVANGVEDLPRSRAAVHALTYFPREAKRRLKDILRNHPDPICRSTALFPLLDSLVGSGDPRDLQLILRALPSDAAKRETVARALPRFRTATSLAVMVEALSDLRLDLSWRVTLLEVLERGDSSSAKKAVVEATRSSEFELRRRAIELVAARGDEESRKLLRSIVDEGRDAGEALRLLGSLRDIDPTWVAELLDVVRTGSIHVQIAAVKSLGALPTQESLRALHRLLRGDEWCLQVAVVRALGQLRQRQSLRHLIEALGSTRGRVRDEVHLQLRLMTGLDMGPRPDRWKTWYTDQNANFVMPSVAEAERIERLRNVQGGLGSSASFYGIQVVSDRVCFLIDVSGSMSAVSSGLTEGSANARASGSSSSVSTRLDAAKSELNEVLRQMLDGARVNIIAFEDGVRSMRTRISVLNGNVRRRAREFVKGLNAGGGTNIRRAIWQGFQDKNIDTLFLLSDGGTNDPDLRRAVAELNRDRFVRIHGIAVGTPSPLLQDLALDSGGQYVEVF